VREEVGADLGEENRVFWEGKFWAGISWREG
jgi:hypothetical protein